MNALPTIAVILALSGGELIIIAVIALILLAGKYLPGFFIGLGQGIRDFRKASRDVQKHLDEAAGEVGEHAGGAFGKPVADALTHANQAAEFLDPPALQPGQLVRNMRDTLILWIAQGFGIGRVPFAPGTFGSLLGVGYWWLLTRGGSWVYWPVFVLGLLLAVWLSGAAAEILRKPDPANVVIDEICAMPLALAGIGHVWWHVVLGFVWFRVFDVWKPPP
ncbi:MAG: phosphatidylglycerophosphatase A, partial [Verrucomicrobia bacterium]|nr:phosphatidylglycerophosphatase A [Verrucomicrobiota bacterium]